MDTDVAWKVGRIMLRYRPIAPKPVVGGGGVASASGGALEISRKKRKAGNSRRGRRVKVSSPVRLTLPLMPETPERKEETPPLPSPTASDLLWQSQGGTQAVVLLAAESSLIVECVTDTWREGEVGVGGGDVEVRRGLEGDTCPCFVSDLEDRVTWTNAAYRRMVVQVPAFDDQDVRSVELVTRGIVPPGVTCRAFTCRMRVTYSCGRRGRVSMAAPCDVWRLADGGLAWRLDVKAALCLGLGS